MARKACLGKISRALSKQAGRMHVDIQCDVVIVGEGLARCA
jgi:hypothetical protein